MARTYAESSLVSKISFGFLVPNFSAEVIKIFAPIHERTYASIQSTIELSEVTTSLLLNCDADANDIAVLMKNLEENDTSANRGIFKDVFDNLSTAISEDSGPSHVVDEILNHTGNLINRAHDDVKRVSLILKRIQFMLEEIKYASACSVASASKSPNVSGFDIGVTHRQRPLSGSNASDAQ